MLLKTSVITLFVSIEIIIDVSLPEMSVMRQLANTVLILKPHPVPVPNHITKPEPERWANGLMAFKEYKEYNVR